MATSLLENLLITVSKFMCILMHLFQEVVILPKVEPHSSLCGSIFKKVDLLGEVICLQVVLSARHKGITASGKKFVYEKVVSIPTITVEVCYDYIY